MKFGKGGVLLWLALSMCLQSSRAEAHWCDDLWGSAYNLVVRPETDTVTVPSSGPATLTIYLQNNMEYALPDFELSAQAGNAYITIRRLTQKVSGTLLPGEKAKFQLTIDTSAGTVINATDIDYSVRFGYGQAGQYGESAASGAKAAMIKLPDGSLSPTPPAPGVGRGNTQAASLYLAAAADFGNTEDGLNKLVNLYCAGRASWDSGDVDVIRSNCPSATETVCPTTRPDSAAGSKFDYMHLWAAGELAARKSALGSRTAVLRKRLQCGVNDDNNGFAGFALFVLGYLGEDAGARAFIEGKIGEGGDIGTIAKAALLLMGNPDDMTTYKADVVAGTASQSIFVKAACSAALGIAAKDDAVIENSLIPLCQWREPDTSEDNGQAIYSAQLLNIVAWDRRGWAPNAGDTGAISFYGENASGGGGAVGTGGRIGTGGRTGTGGSPGTGGRSGTGGAGGSGGAKGTGGRTGSGGSAGRGTGGSAGIAVGGRAGGSTVQPGTGGRLGLGGSTGGFGGGTAIGGFAGAPPVGYGGVLPPAAGGVAGAAVTGLVGTGGVPGTVVGVGGASPIDGGGALDDQVGSGCKCHLGGDDRTGIFFTLAMVGLALLLGRRRGR